MHGDQTIQFIWMNAKFEINDYGDLFYGLLRWFIRWALLSVCAPNPHDNISTEVLRRVANAQIKKFAY